MIDQTQAFIPSQMRDVIPIFYDKAEQLRDIFLDMSNKPTTLPPPGANPIPLPRVDVLNWLGRATLDVIGLAGGRQLKVIIFIISCLRLGFGYTFSSLTDSENELALAFGVIFSAARKFRAVNILQAWFPWLKRVVMFCRQIDIKCHDSKLFIIGRNQ